MFKGFPLLLAQLIFICFLAPQQGSSQQISEPDIEEHAIILYVFPEAKKIEWESPSTLVKSTLKVHARCFFKNNIYKIGHYIIGISSSLLDEEEFISVKGPSEKEKRHYVSVEKIGLGIMGVSLTGRMETHKEVMKAIESYKRKGEINYIKFLVDSAAIKRAMVFKEHYCPVNEYGFAPCDLYNGALWPEYHYEGAGCANTSFSLLSILNILPAHADEDWKVSVKMPMDLIGGEFNNNKKIRVKDIRKRKHWYEGEGIENVDYINYEIYSPWLTYEWIEEVLKRGNDLNYHPHTERGIGGLVIDYTKTLNTENEILEKKQEFFNPFIKNHYEKFKIHHESESDIQGIHESMEVEEVGGFEELMGN